MVVPPDRDLFSHIFGPGPQESLVCGAQYNSQFSVGSRCDNKFLLGNEMIFVELIPVKLYPVGQRVCISGHLTHVSLALDESSLV